jgi:hypothetical protein
MREPSGLKAADVTPFSWRRTAISLALAASQMRAVLSCDAVTMRDPSGLNAAEVTQSSWPRKTAICLPVPQSDLSRFQSQMILRYTPSASALPSNHLKVAAAQRLSLIRSPDAPYLCEISGLETRLAYPAAAAVRKTMASIAHHSADGLRCRYRSPRRYLHRGARVTLPSRFEKNLPESARRRLAFVGAGQIRRLGIAPTVSHARPGLWGARG